MPCSSVRRRPGDNTPSALTAGLATHGSGWFPPSPLSLTLWVGRSRS